VEENILAYDAIWRRNVHQEGIAHLAAKYPQPKIDKLAYCRGKITRIFAGLE
jgi:hypothetical protein